MPKLVVSGAAQVRLIWQYTNGAQAINVLGATKVSGTIDQTTADLLGSAVKTAVGSSGLNIVLSTAYALQLVGVRDIGSPNLPEFFDSGPPAGGSASEDPLPGQNALCVTLRTAGAGQSFRGRVYLGGFTEAGNTADGQISLSVIDPAVAFLNSVKQAMASNGLTMAVVSRPSLLVTITTDTTNADGSHSIKVQTRKARPGGHANVTSIEARNAIWDSQRRRSAAGSQSTLRQPLARIIS
jgi:hypothetical protein